MSYAMFIMVFGIIVVGLVRLGGGGIIGAFLMTLGLAC